MFRIKDLLKDSLLLTLEEIAFSHRELVKNWKTYRTFVRQEKSNSKQAQ